MSKGREDEFYALIVGVVAPLAIGWALDLPIFYAVGALLFVVGLYSLVTHS